MNLHRYHIVFLFLVLLTACSPKVPSEYIQPDDMEDILYDYFVSQGIAKQENLTSSGSSSSRPMDYKRELYFEAVLKKYDLTRAEFDSSLVYYYTRSDRFVKIWKNVQERLGEAAIEYGASAGEVENFTASTLTGDTANIWNGAISQVLVPYAPYNRLQYRLQADTAYRKGDSFMLAWNSNFLYQSGSKDEVAYIAVKYKNDSVASSVTHFSVDGRSQLRIEGCEEPVKEINGFIYLGQGYENTSNLRMLIVSNIQLIRFHKKEHEEVVPQPQKSVADSLSQVPDSLRPRHHRLGERPDQIKPITQ
jgi:hypothetical protein